jgi:hypothetical protein
VFIFFNNDILTYSIFDEEYECHNNLVLEALREKHLYVELKKGAFYLFGASHSNQVINQYDIAVNPKNVQIC